MRLGFFAVFLCYGLTMPYLAPALIDVGYTKLQIGMITAGIYFFKTSVPLMAGRVSDRYLSADRVIRFASLGLSAFSGLLWHQSGQPSWGLVMTLFGLMACLSPCVPMMDTLAMQSAAGRPREYARIRLVGSLGFAIAVTGFGYILDATDITAFFPAVFVAFLFFMVQTLRLPKEEKTATPEHAANFWSTLTPNWWLWLGAMALHWFCFGPYHYGFTLLLEEQAVSAKLTGWMWSIGVGAEIAVFFLSGKLFARWNFHQLLLLALVSNFVRWLALGLYPTPWMIAATQLLHGFGFALYYAAAIQGIQHYCGGANRASYQGMFSTVVSGFASILGTFASGWLHEQMPFREMILWFTPIQALAVIVLVFNPLRAAPNKPQTPTTAAT